MMMDRIRIALFLIITFTPVILFAQSAYFQKKSTAVWEDPEFVDRFLGSYGFLSGAEPKVKDEEIEAFNELIPIIQDNPKAAILRLEQEMAPDSSAALDFILGNLYFQTDRLDKAAATYQAAIKKFPDFRRAYKNLGLVYVLSDKPKEAIQSLTKAVELGEHSARVLGLLGYCYFNQSQYVASETFYRKAAGLDPETRDWQLGLAQSLLNQEKYVEAEAFFKDLLREYPDNLEYWSFLANTSLGQDKPEEAARYLEIVRLSGQIQRQSLELLGDIYLVLDMPDRALEAYTAVLEESDASSAVPVLLRAVQIMVQKGDFDQAGNLIRGMEETFNQTLTEQQRLELLNAQAKIARAQGRDADALEALESIVAVDPLNGEALMELAGHYRRKQDSERAILFLDRAKNLKGYESKALLEHAWILVSQKKYADATPLIKRSLELKPDTRIEDYLRKVERAAARQRRLEA